MSDRLVEAGRARAASLGWPDAYAYTKALGERALVETHGDVPISIVRPSIIESALAEPRPGWIRGFRMAEPVIISYARGLLKEFPGVPEGIVDVIPVDLVVGAIIAVAAKGPERGADGDAVPEVVQVASGSQNPLRYRRLVDLVSSWFLEHPLYDHEGQPIVVPAWSFPGRGRVQGQLQRAKTTLERVERVLSNLPLRGRQAEFSATIEERREEAERALGYVELYGAYAECEAVYGLDRLLALWAAQTPDDQARFCFDPRVIDWDHYVRDVHLPSVVEHGRVRTTPGGRVGPDRETRLRGQVLSPDRQLAAFDLENTLIASNVVASYSWLATRRLPGDERLRFVARTLAEAPSLLALDRKDRSDFLRLFYRRYDKRADRPDRRGRRRDVQPADPGQVVPRRDPPRARAPAPRTPHRPHHRRPRLRGRAAAPAVRRHRVRIARSAHRRHLRRRAHRGPADRARRGRRRSWTSPSSTASISASPLPTPTRPATCRCSKRSASRSQ